MQRDAAGNGLRTVSGFLAGLLGGAIGAVISVALSRTDTVRGYNTNVTYLVTFGSYGAVLGAVLLASNAAKREPNVIIRWLLGGAILGGGVAGLGSLALIRAIVEPVLRRSDDPKNAFMLAVALIFGALGLCLGVALGVSRGGNSTIVSAIAGAAAGAIGGAAYVEYALFWSRLHTQSDFDRAAAVVLTALGAVMGFVIGAVGPVVSDTPAVVPVRTGVRMPTAAPAAAPMPVIPWSYPRVDQFPLESAPPPAPAPAAPSPVSVAPAPAPRPAPAPVSDARPLLVDVPAGPAPPPPPPVVEAPRVVQAPPPEAPPRFGLTLDDGRRFAVPTRVIIGRDPQRVRRDDADALLVSVNDPAQTVSTNHVAITWQEGRVFVEDRGSVHGTAVVSPSGVQTRIEHATPIQVGDGWIVMFGARRAQVSRL